MKKIMATLALALTFAVVAGSAAPQKDLPIPSCFPCASRNVTSSVAPQRDLPIPSCFPCASRS